MIIAQISDTHLLLDGPDGQQRLADFNAVIDDINALDPAPDAIVHTGDIVHNGRADEYAAAAEILGRAKAPVYVMAGNKDDRAGLRAVFSCDGYLADEDTFIEYDVEELPVRLLMLDTVNMGSPKGTYCTRRIARLQKTLANDTDKPTAVFTHHPPFEVFVGPERFHFDDLDVMARLADTLKGSPHVIGLFCGHVHRPTFAQVGAIPATVIPSVATALRYGDYPACMATKPIYFVHRLNAPYGFTTETHIAGH